MRWSWTVTRLAGIDLKVHATFPLLFVWVVGVALGRGGGAGAAVGAVGWVLAVFAMVVLHELGHALAARRYGIGTRDITLLPIGGIARLERFPDRPRQELVVALAGPAVNGVLALFALAVRAGLGWALPAGIARASCLEAAGQLAWINAFLGAFNLLPAFPMDGGRVLRALLAFWMDGLHATQIAASVGQTMALLFGLVGLLGNPLFLLVAVFVWVGASAEATLAQLEQVMGGVRVRDAMVTHFEALAPEDPLDQAVAHVLAGFQHDFPVLEEGRLVGLLTRSRLVERLARGGAGESVGECMQPGPATVHPNELLAGAFTRLQESEARTFPVVHEGTVVGLLSLENLGEFLMVRSALARRRPGRPEERRAAVGSRSG